MRHKEEFILQCLAQGHFNTYTAEIGKTTSSDIKGGWHVDIDRSGLPMNEGAAVGAVCV